MRNQDIEDAVCSVCFQPIEYIGVVDPGGTDHGWSHREYDDGLDHKAEKQTVVGSTGV